MFIKEATAACHEDGNGKCSGLLSSAIPVANGCRCCFDEEYEEFKVTKNVIS
jgi:hypothetical protein